MRITIAIILAILIASTTRAENVSLSKVDYGALLVGNYVHGFKEFETSVTAYEDYISVAIYYDLSTQSNDRAQQLAKRFRENVSSQLSAYDWTKNIRVEVSVYSEDRSGRGY